MPLQTIDRPRIGDRVTVAGKTGAVMDISDKVKVKFDDGTFGFFEEGQVSSVLQDTRLKGISCPFCKSDSLQVSQERYFGGDNVFQCMKCMERFSKDSDFVITYKSRTFCKNCGKRTAKHAGQGLYKCENCECSFKLN
jgi:ribosomal protein L37AE/L43A